MSRKTSVVIDRRLLKAVKAILDTRTVRDTIAKAFEEVLKQKARCDEVTALSEMDGMDLGDEAVMARAWRH
jgi:hypothetical protein